MTLNAERKFNRVVSCISGEFINDMTPCAPNGCFGLSYLTGTASLAAIVDRWQDYSNHCWQDYSNHYGGVVGHNASATTISFHGGWFNPEKKNGGWSDQWSFTANRLTGEGKLKVDGQPDLIYTCTKATQRF